MHAAAKSARFIKYLSQYRAPRSRWRYYQNKFKNIIILPSSINNSFIKLYSTEPMDLSKDQEWKKISSEVLEVGYYLECRKNHAASIGKYAVDGCCEFMPAGDEGSVASLLCAACSCHRSFHKKVVQWLEIVGDYGSDFKPSTPK